MSLFGVIAHLFKKAWASFYEARNGPHWRAVRKQRLKVDKNRCQSCKATNNLHVHHKNGWAWFPLERFDLSNLVTLCERCHSNFHSHNGGYREKCTKKDYYRWIRLPKAKRVN